MWILILTIVSNGISNSHAGYAMSSVHGFTSKSACRAAANSWLNQPKPEHSLHQKHAICAKA